MKHLRASLPATMAGIASQAGLRLAFGQPRTDGKTVWVSDIPINPTEDDYNVVVSDLIHEVGHIKYTDFNLDRGGHTLMPALTNVFEDVRIEKALQSEYLGARNFLDEGYKVVTAAGKQRQPDSPANALTMWLLLDHMIKVNGRSFWDDERDQAYQACLQFGLTPELLESIDSLCTPRVPKLTSTADVIQLSKEVLDLLKQAQEEDQKQNDQEDSGNGSNGPSAESNDDNDGQPSSESDDKSESDSTSQSSGENQPENDESGTDDQSNSGDTSGSGAEELLQSDVNEASPISLRDLAQAIADNVEKEESLLMLIGNSQDIAEELREVNGSGMSQNYYDECVIQSNIFAYNRLKQAVAKDVQVLKRRLVHHWQNESRTRDLVNEHDGRFSVNDAIRCCISGENNYLVKRTKRINHKPAVCVLADLSGSMSEQHYGDSLINHQTKALIALCEACDLAGIPLNIMGFSNRVVNAKKWNSPMAKARGAIGGMRPLGGTNIVTGVFEGIRALSVRKERRKILVTLTDGEIGGAAPYLSNQMEYATKHNPGFDFYGLGIGTNLGRVFPKGGRVNPDKLAESLLEILSK